jgi:hypothetical protein
MVPLAVRAAREIEHRLLQEARAPERALFDHYLRTANRTNRPAVPLNAGTMITNAAAARILQALRPRHALGAGVTRAGDAAAPDARRDACDRRIGLGLL